MGKMGKSWIRHWDRNNAIYIQQTLFSFILDTAKIHFSTPLLGRAGD